MSDNLSDKGRYVNLMERERSAGGDVDDFFGDDDDFLDGLAFEGSFYFFAGEGDFFDVGVGSVRRDFNEVAEFAVDLHGEFEGALDEEGGIKLGPGCVGERSF